MSASIVSSFLKDHPESGRLLISALLTVFILLTGCIGESAFRVHVEIAGVEESRPCVMELHYADSGKVVATVPERRAFKESVVIPPGTNHYYITIECSGTPTAYKSATYELVTAEHVRNLVEL